MTMKTGAVKRHKDYVDVLSEQEGFLHTPEAGGMGSPGEDSGREARVGPLPKDARPVPQIAFDPELGVYRWSLKEKR
jgi:hypothetical protein